MPLCEDCWGDGFCRELGYGSGECPEGTAGYWKAMLRTVLQAVADEDHVSSDCWDTCMPAFKAMGMDPEGDAAREHEEMRAAYLARLRPEVELDPDFFTSREHDTLEALHEREMARQLRAIEEGPEPVFAVVNGEEVLVNMDDIIDHLVEVQ